MLVDAHVHLDLYKNPNEIAKKCLGEDLTIFSMTTTPKAWRGTVALSQGNPKIKTFLGLHPQLAHQRHSELCLFDTLFPTTNFIGEIGLDGSQEFRAYREIQLKVFRHILKQINSSNGRILSLHSRHSAETVLEEIKNVNGTPILHWFSGNKNDLNTAISQGCWFSVGPAMINTNKGKMILSQIPRNKLLLETDGPFGRISGKSLHPWDVEVAYNMIAKEWNVSREEVDSEIHENYLRLLNIV